MPELALYLLGPPRVELDGRVLHIPRRKALALLAYLALSGDRQQRDTLATLFWPEYDQSGARTDLRRHLSLLNRVLGSGWIDADRESAGLAATCRSGGPADGAQGADAAASPGRDEHSGTLWLDVRAFQEGLDACATHDHPPDQACSQCVALLEDAAALYRDDFLAGFTLSDSAAFDGWQFFQTQSLRDGLGGALERLATWYGEYGDHERAISHARRWLSLDPLHEPAHRELMQLYARSGQRAAALRQYRQCVRVLEDELGVSPVEETTALYERIRAQRPQLPEERPAALAPPSLSLPVFLSQEQAPEPERPVFVSREPELAQLQGYLDAALSGEGGVAFVTGGAGRGKTALMTEFARDATDAHPDLLVAAGNCSAYAGLGDPYLPFREILNALTGDVGGRRAAGALTQEQARRLWQAMPAAVEALLAHGDALVDTFVSSSALLARAEAAAPQDASWLRRLREQIKGARPEPGDLAQDRLLEQVTEVLRALAARRPLLLSLDDLQWVDAASASLLFHLGRCLEGSRILVLAAYRPDEVALGRGGERHPLAKVLAEFRRHYGDVWVDLRRADAQEGRAFVDAFLDTEPNRLGGDFRSALFQHTEGHPLFTVELLRAMEARGDLVQDEDGRWVEGPVLYWQRLPARVEAVIEERIGRVAPELRELLAVASVEGETFTAQVLAQVQGMGERELLRALSRELEGRHRLVQEERTVPAEHRPLVRYRFAHALYQQHLYSNLGQGERMLLHGEVAEALEGLYAGQTDEIVPQLARHYAEAGEAGKAVAYLSRAGDRARLAYAYREAVEHYGRALAFLKEQGRHERAARMLMKLGLTHHNAFRYAEARQAYDEGFALWQRAGRAAPAVTLPPAPHTLRVIGPDWSEPLTLDPAFALDADSGTAISQLFSGLTALGPEQEVAPDVAQRWEVLDGGRTYVFYLREDVRWSDGVPVTAGDFEYAWKRALDPTTEALRAEEFYPIRCARAYHQGEEADPQRVGVRALDDHTLVVELEGPATNLLRLAAHHYAVAVPRHAVEAYGTRWAEPDRLVTNGPFRLAAWERGASLILERSPTYHRRTKGNVERVKVLFGAAYRASALQLYEQDRLDVVGLRTATSLTTQEAARQRHAAEYLLQPRLSLRFVGLDLSRPPFHDRRVRRSLAMATDREMLADVVFKGVPFPASGGLRPPWLPGHSPGIALPYDPVSARRLLAEAGYPGGRGFPTVQVLAPDHPMNVLVCEYLRAHWLDVLGIDVSWEMVAWRQFIERLRPGSPSQVPSLWYCGLDMPLGPNDRLLPIEGWLAVGWRHKAYERLERESEQVVDLEAQLRIHQQADRILVEEAPAILLLYERLGLLVKPWVTHLPLGAVGGPWWKDVVIEPH